MTDGVGSYAQPSTWDFSFGDGQPRAHDFYFGKMANMMHYNRILSATEVAQNFNAQKARFGITS